MGNELTLLSQKYKNIDTIDSISISDNFVKRNKTGIGHGEAKFYIGSRQKVEEQSFFCKQQMRGFFLKKDLLEYLEDAKFEYKNTEQDYRNDITNYWSGNKQSINNQEEDKLFFNFKESSAGGNKRFYITSEKGDIFYNEFRTIALPEITYISILKLNNIHEEEIYYFKPYLNYFYDSRHHSSIIDEEEKQIDNNTTIEKTKKAEIKYARKGQGKYRAGVIDIMSECLITRVNDERMLIASHIKPWAICETNDERIDKYNGLLLTPTYDKLFDQGFITFSNDGIIDVSPYLSPLNAKKLSLVSKKKYDLPINEKRSSYLNYHRKNIFKG